MLISLLILTISVFAKPKLDPEEQKDHNIWDLMDQSKALFGMKTFYELLSVSEEATSEEIRVSYRKHALELHPDKNPSEEASKKFKVLGGIQKILRNPELREKYNHWLNNGIPWWRGRTYYTRKTEDLSLLQSLLIILSVVSAMQYVAMWVRYFQIKSGLVILSNHRELLANAKNKSKGGKTNTRIPPGGIFDDANMHAAMDWLVKGKGVHPDSLLEKSNWIIDIKEKFNGDENKLVITPPMPWNTIVFTVPFMVYSMVFKKNDEKKE